MSSKQADKIEKGAGDEHKILTMTTEKMGFISCPVHLREQEAAPRGGGRGGGGFCEPSFSMN